MSLMRKVMAGGLTCKQVDNLLDDAIDGKLSRLMRWRLSVHKATCAICRRYAKQYALVAARAREALRLSSEKPDRETIARWLAAMTQPDANGKGG